MQLTSQFRLALAVGALCAAAAATITCGSGNSQSAIPTRTPFYYGTDVFPTSPPGSDLPTPENLPVPTLTAEPTVTASGLKVYDVQVGDGAEAQTGGVVYITYTLWVQGGNEIDRTRTGPVRYRLAKGQVIDGLIEGISGMKVGGNRRLIIPPALGYGSKGTGNVIPPNATLIYDIELVAPPGQPTSILQSTGEGPATAVP
jgi:FKBP-type peptidyl-prolyl cis-trans isomerase FkpA